MTFSVTLDRVTKIYGRMRETLHILSGCRLAVGDGRRALDDVSLSLREGERVGFIGRNGAGKSTLLRLVAGLTSCSHGSVTVEGRISSMLTLGLGLRDDLAGYENILIDGEMRGLSRSEVMKDIDAIIDFADLGEAIHRPVRTYSSGMKARLAFSMLSFIEPEILLIDETLSVGDADFAEKARGRIAELCGQGRIAMLVSHSMDSVQDLCNRAIWLDQGRVMQDGPPEEVCLAYLDHVHREDERIWLRRFDVGRHDQGSRRALFTKLAFATAPIVGCDFDISVGYNLAEPVDAVSMRVSVERVDGLKIAEQDLSLGEMVAGPHDGRITVRPLTLAPGLYCLRLILIEDGAVLAWRAAVLEVTAQRRPPSGYPMLICPSRATVTRRRENGAGL